MTTNVRPKNGASKASRAKRSDEGTQRTARYKRAELRAEAKKWARAELTRGFAGDAELAATAEGLLDAAALKVAEWLTRWTDTAIITDGDLPPEVVSGKRKKIYDNAIRANHAVALDREEQRPEPAPFANTWSAWAARSERMTESYTMADGRVVKLHKPYKPGHLPPEPIARDSEPDWLGAFLFVYQCTNEAPYRLRTARELAIIALAVGYLETIACRDFQTVAECAKALEKLLEKRLTRIAND